MQADATPSPPAPLGKVALPSEHGGWSLTLEPVVLGLIVAPTWAGAALGMVALLGFMLRTPLKLALGDRRRGRKLPRTVLAQRVVAAELLALLAALAAAAVLARAAFWLPLVVAAPLFLLEMWFDVRSRSRHLLPELAGTIGVGAVATAIALAGTTDTATAWGLWVIAAGRAVAAIPFVRVQLRRAKHQPHRVVHSDAAQAVAVLAIATATAAGTTSPVAAVALASLAAIHVVLVRVPPPKAAVLGAEQVVLGLAIVVAAGLAAVAP